MLNVLFHAKNVKVLLYANLALLDCYLIKAVLDNALPLIIHFYKNVKNVMIFVNSVKIQILIV